MSNIISCKCDRNKKQCNCVDMKAISHTRFKVCNYHFNNMIGQQPCVIKPSPRICTKAYPVQQRSRHQPCAPCAPCAPRQTSNEPGYNYPHRRPVLECQPCKSVISPETYPAKPRLKPQPCAPCAPCATKDAYNEPAYTSPQRLSVVECQPCPSQAKQKIQPSAPKQVCYEIVYPRPPKPSVEECEPCHQVICPVPCPAQSGQKSQQPCAPCAPCAPKTQTSNDPVNSPPGRSGMESQSFRRPNNIYISGSYSQLTFGSASKADSFQDCLDVCDQENVVSKVFLV